MRRDHRRVARGVRFAGLLALATLAGTPAAAAGQDGAPASLQGRVVDADGGQPVPAASVALVEVPGSTDPDTLADAVRAKLTVAEEATDAGGRYRFGSVAPGRYLLRVERIGYRTVSVQVQVGSRPTARVSLAMEVEPIAMPPLEIEARGEAELTTPDGGRLALGRVAAIRLRQRRFLTSDSRVVTPTDLAESVTLGETDIFRTIQRLPGVTTRDDWSAELWTRGAEWGQTRVYMDGMPLFNPLHGGGLLSGMSARGLAAAFFHPGVRPVHHPEGGAAVLDLRSRSGLGRDGMDGGAEVTLASGQAWLAGPLGDRTGASLTARRSWADLAVGAVTDDPADEVPYDFADVQLRVDSELAPGLRGEISGLWERDRVRGEIPDVLHGTAADWGNVTLGAALTWEAGALRFRQAAGGTRYHARVDSIDGGADTLFSAPSAEPADHRVRHLGLHGEVGPRDADEGSWRVGYDVIRQSTRYVGPEPWPYSSQPPDLPEVDRAEALLRFAVWGSDRFALTDRLTLDAGLRVAAGGETRRGAAEVAPSAALRYDATPELALHAGAGRYLQYAQSPAGVGPRIETVIQTGRLWILADRDEPYLDVRLATVGAEAWLGDAWLASATAYLRRTDGLLLPDPTPGRLILRRPLVVGRSTARGLDLGLRKVAGRVTGSLGYSLSRAEARALEIAFPAPTDRTHTVDATLLARITGGFHIGTAYTYASGAPYTRVVDCPDPGCLGVILDAPFRRRAPAYSSLDLSLDFTHRFDGWALGWFLQARNLLGRRNAVTYQTTSEECVGNGCGPDTPRVPTDRFVQGIPRLPLLGIRVTF